MLNKERDKVMVIETDKNGVVLRKIDQATGEDQLISSVMDGGNWSKENTQKRVERLLKRPTIQKLFEEYYYDYNREKHKFEHLEEKSEQSWYLDSKGNIKEHGNAQPNLEGEEDAEEEIDDKRSLQEEEKLEVDPEKSKLL